MVGIRYGRANNNGVQKDTKPTHHHDELVHRPYQRRGQPGLAVDRLGYRVTRDFSFGHVVADGGHAIMVTCVEQQHVKRMRRGGGRVSPTPNTHLQKRPSGTRSGPRCWSRRYSLRRPAARGTRPGYR